VRKIYLENLYILIIIMSNSIAAAKRRRAGVIEQPPPVPSVPPQQGQGQGQGQISSRLTLPQVISMLDARLVKLENSPIQEQPVQSIEGSVSISEYVVEMDHKFSVLVEEITTLKDIVLKLQAYTMDVNKMLVDERIQIMSEFETPGVKEERITLEAIDVDDEIQENA
jgi:hypothetical protein